MTIALLLAAAAVGAVAFTVVRLALFDRWYRLSTQGTAWFGLTTAGKAAFAAELRRRGAFPARVVALLSRVRPLFPGARRTGGFTAPPHCPDERFRFAAGYEPQPCDVFVVTQMKCGTTWMLQLVYEVSMRGRGDLGDEGARHIHAVCPWIESTWTVRIADAPRLGDRALRVIKSHLPAGLLPIREPARYIYVTRNPVGCFASTVDFLTMLIEPIAPDRAGFLDWFCSDGMWWGSWPDHVAGWWRAAAAHPNVLFVHYEEMLADLPGTVDRVARFLDVDLAGDERAEVVRKSGFAWMKEHEDRFSMSPPTVFSADGSFLRSGEAARDTDVERRERERIAAFCRERLRGAAYPFARFYPDLS